VTHRQCDARPTIIVARKCSARSHCEKQIETIGLGDAFGMNLWFGTNGESERVPDRRCCTEWARTKGQISAKNVQIGGRGSRCPARCDAVPVYKIL